MAVEHKTQVGIKSLIAPYSRIGEIKSWAIPLMLIGVVLCTLGMIDLAMYYSHIKYIGKIVTDSMQPSVVEGWVYALIGFAFYVVSFQWGIKFQKEAKKEFKND